jgi:nucleoside-diphosphate-sugar epimerase
VSYVTKTEDPRDYKVSFERIKNELGYEPHYRVPSGIEELVGALEQERFGDPFSPRYSNIG